MDEYRYDDACSSVYSFIYERYCSWFIELSKKVLHGDDAVAKVRRAQVLKLGFRQVVALLHPFTPYITEELWMYLKREDEDLLIVQDYPEFREDWCFENDQERMSCFIEVVTNIRNLRASVNIKPKDKAPVSLFCDDADLRDYFIESELGFSELAKVDGLSVVSKAEARPEKSIMSATTHSEIFLPLDGVIDLDSQVDRLEKELEKSQQGLKKFDQKLSNAKFTDHAPEAVVQETRDKAEAMREKVKSIESQLKQFKP
jgi:valyl-tRNA synthetase